MNMRVVSFLNNKGGVGKTTLCANVARAFARNQKNKVLLIDADCQKSLSHWHNAGDGLGLDLVCADTRASLLSSLKLARQAKFDLVMIDTPGRLMALTGAALSITDIAIIPVQASPLDVWATYDTINLVRAARNANPNLAGMIVINQAIPNCLITTDVKNAIKDEMNDIYLAQTVIHGRIAFAKTVNDGKTAFETKDKQAIGEIECLSVEILGGLYAAQNQAATKE
jgi:chromosome partitioning protein